MPINLRINEPQARLLLTALKNQIDQCEMTADGLKDQQRIEIMAAHIHQQIAKEVQR